MPDLLIRNLPNETIRQVKALAVKHKNSLQQEISRMLVEAVRFQSGNWSAQADAIRERLAKKRKIYSDSTALIREDRDR